jgi:hypothetical protein
MSPLIDALPDEIMKDQSAAANDQAMSPVQFDATFTPAHRVDCKHIAVAVPGCISALK